MTKLAVGPEIYPIEPPIPSPDNDDYLRCQHCDASYRFGVRSCPNCGIPFRPFRLSSVALNSRDSLLVIFYSIGTMLFGVTGATSLLIIALPLFFPRGFNYSGLFILVPLFLITTPIAVVFWKKMGRILGTQKP